MRVVLGLTSDPTLDKGDWSNVEITDSRGNRYRLVERRPGLLEVNGSERIVVYPAGGVNVVELAQISIGEPYP